MFSAEKFVKMHERKLLLIVRFLVIFNLLAIPMYLILISGTTLPALQEVTTDVVFAIFRALGYSAERAGFTITFTAPLQASIVIDTDCTGWKSMYAFAALVVATPFAMGRKKRSMIVAMGVAVLFLLNIVRIVSTVVAAVAFGIATLDVVHTLLWREGMILAVLALWVISVRPYAEHARRGPEKAADI